MQNIRARLTAAHRAAAVRKQKMQSQVEEVGQQHIPTRHGAIEEGKGKGCGYTTGTRCKAREPFQGADLLGRRGRGNSVVVRLRWTCCDVCRVVFRPRQHIGGARLHCILLQSKDGERACWKMSLAAPVSPRD